MVPTHPPFHAIRAWLRRPWSLSSTEPIRLGFGQVIHPSAPNVTVPRRGVRTHLLKMDENGWNWNKMHETSILKSDTPLKKLRYVYIYIYILSLLSQKHFRVWWCFSFLGMVKRSCPSWSFLLSAHGGPTSMEPAKCYKWHRLNFRSLSGKNMKKCWKKCGTFCLKNPMDSPCTIFRDAWVYGFFWLFLFICRQSVVLGGDSNFTDSDMICLIVFFA